MSFTSGELRDFIGAVRGSDTSTDAVVTGTVARVDPDGTAWVQIGQNPEPTPCARDMACHAGDEVTVRIADHKATVTGNASAPATDDKKANVAYNYAGQANETATVAQSTANQAQKVAANAATKADVAEIAAQEAARVASAVNQHFWDDERGAHVTEEAKDDYLVEPSGFQQLMTSIGTLLTRAVNGIEYLLRSDTQSGTAFYDGTVAADDANLDDHVVAKFTADGAQIGKRNQNHVEMDFNSFNMVDRENNTFYTVEDLRDENGMFEYSETITIDDETERTHDLLLVPVEDETTGLYLITVKRNDTTLVQGTDYIVLVDTQVSGQYASITTTQYYSSGTLEVTYTTMDESSKRVLFAGRSASFNDKIGPMSSAFGDYVIASGFASHAEGAGAIASGFASHAEGGHSSGDFIYPDELTIASGSYSHAEGDACHSVGKWSHAEGRYTRANGIATHAEGVGTVANGGRHHIVGQHVEGRWNVLDAGCEYAHIIGCGTDNAHRANLHTVATNGTAWYKNNGNVICSDGTNIRCDGQTIGTANNLSYVLQFPLFKIQELSVTTTAQSGGQFSASVNIPAISGFRPIGCIGMSNSHGTQFACSYWDIVAKSSSPSGYEFNVYGGHTKSGAATDVLFILDILYVRTNLVG